MTRHAGSPDAVVIGGGFAGLAAATALAESGARVTLLEARPHLGGRARSWIDPETGQVVDNGQHLFMGCYRETLLFLERIGTVDRLALQPRMQMHLLDRGGAAGAFALPAIPSPFDRLAAILRFPGLSAADRLGLLRVVRAVKKRSASRVTGASDDLERLSVADWLSSLRQSPASNRRLWHPVSISALNELPERASAAMLLPVLREAFLGDASSARLGVPRVGLSDLYAGPAADYLGGRRCTVRLRSPVRGLLIDQGRCGGVMLAGGERLEAGAVISSVPHVDLPALLPNGLVDDPVFARAARLETSPIVSVYLWFDVPVIDLPFAALVGGMWQWVFDRDHISGGGNGIHGVTLVCSAAYDLVDRPVETLIRSALDELRQFVPGVRHASLRRSMVIKEKKATISPACGTADLRPDQRTPCEALYLAGDWTATGLPATIEGAVLSGHRCARAASGIGVS